eukprot:TRINITY_DN1237_c0_g1_i1.p1 TRINITY_DN1237_c0_g1~~TRINITY_DN1237_c0_g1_i1.p1  ORF type:complete len:424 (-),score=74.95 TRINITY_DN1237_c0_g1_i1:58-1329(-)
MKSKADERLSDQNLDSGVSVIKGVVGDAINDERIKLFILGADGNLEIALNHALNYIEKTPATQAIPIRDTTNALETVLSDLAEEVKCSICLGYFSEPVALDCFHTFCLSCIDQLVNEENRVDCPLCRKNYKLDARGIKGLKYNHYLANIIQKLRSVQATRLCGNCQNQLCTLYCSQCGSFLCESCSHKIHEKTEFQKHTRKPFEDCYFKNNVFSKDNIEKLPWRMEFVISFAVKQETCTGILQNWMNNLWFAPSDLQRGGLITDLEAIYLPYWQFDCFVGDDQTTGRKIMVMATQDYIVPSLLPHTESWDDQHIEPFTGRHLESAKTITISTTPESAWKQYKVNDKNRHALPEVDERGLFAKARVVFVPIYSGIYQYRGKQYHFVINGSNGRCYGQRPYSTGKLSMGVGLGAAIGLLTSSKIH